VFDPLRLSTTSLPLATAASDYGPQNAVVQASGGVAPYTFKLTSGSAPLPPGLTLGTNGYISGTPLLAGRYGFTVEVDDSSSPPYTATAALTIIVAEPITIAGSLPDAFSGVPYWQKLQVSGGYPPFTFNAQIDNWPASLNLGYWDGVISGVPDVVGTLIPRVTVSSSYLYAASATQDVTFIIKPGPLSLTGRTLPAAYVGWGYSTMLDRSGGTPPNTWSVIAGALPDGLTLNGATGELWGRATTPGAYTFTVQVTDSGQPQQTATATFTLTVSSAP